MTLKALSSTGPFMKHFYWEVVTAPWAPTLSPQLDHKLSGGWCCGCSFYTLEPTKVQSLQDQSIPRWHFGNEPSGPISQLRSLLAPHSGTFSAACPSLLQSLPPI